MDCINIYHTVSNTFRARQLASLANFLVQLSTSVSVKSLDNYLLFSE